MHRLLFLSLLAGCPPPTTYLIAEVSAHQLPVADALVAADCGSTYSDAARRTDPSGRAQLEFRRKVDASKCALTIAAPGFETVEATNVSICTTPACPATHVELDGPRGLDDGPRDPYEDELRTYARPPLGGRR